MGFENSCRFEILRAAIAPSSLQGQDPAAEPAEASASELFDLHFVTYDIATAERAFRAGESSRE